MEVTGAAHWVFDYLWEEFETGEAGKSGLSSCYEVVNLLFCHLIQPLTHKSKLENMHCYNIVAQGQTSN